MAISQRVTLKRDGVIAVTVICNSIAKAFDFVYRCMSYLQLRPVWDEGEEIPHYVDPGGNQFQFEVKDCDECD